MKTIWKFVIAPEPKVEMPVGAEVLTVKEVGGKACIWAIVDSEQKQLEIRTFRIYGTGHMLPDNSGKYIGTFITDGYFVWHVFEEIPDKKGA